jgi:hypothetical protein
VVSQVIVKTAILHNEQMKLTLILSSIFLACSLHAQSVASLQAEIAALQKEVAALKPLAALAPFISVDPNPQNGVQGSNITFHGANVHIVNGTGQTGTVNGTGNLIIGYDELPPNILLPVGGRSGSHNLVVGMYHQFTSTGFGNLVAGEKNVANGEAGQVAGGYNTVSGTFNSILGGVTNYARGSYSVVCGGGQNWTTNVANVILGGYDNQENANYAVIVGGYGNVDASSGPGYTVIQ